MTASREWRRSTQPVAPSHHSTPPAGEYNLYPAFPIGSGKIELGFSALARWLINHRQVMIDGYPGVLWDDFRNALDAALRDLGACASWHDTREALLPEAVIDDLIAPFLGGDDPLFGTRFTGDLQVFFAMDRLAQMRPDSNVDLSLVFGCGAALTAWDGPVVYVDVPKAEIQFRSRAGAVCNLGTLAPSDPKSMYKRFYFVDWPAANAHKKRLLPNISLIIDEQRPDEPAMMTGDDLRNGLAQMAHSPFRARPWFEPGPWGGQWLKNRIPALPQDVPNYAWSFELITPENGVMFESEGRLLEVSFDMLMFAERDRVLGDFAGTFGDEFPIRFDFLDTIGGGNLSLQCHPRPGFIRTHFGEAFTQDETYYILDSQPGAKVYLGFREDIEPAAFREALEGSVTTGEPIDVERFVSTENAHPHALFLIPSGTVHCAGAGVLVLEISATPYIFTFKMYDWQRMDLEGKPRPLNIRRAFDNLDFDRKGAVAREELVAKPVVVENGEGWRLIHLSTHPDHFYDVHRFELDGSVEVATAGSPHVLSLVEGHSLNVETANGVAQGFSFAETFVIPAAADHYRLTNTGRGTATVVKAFLKAAWQPPSSDLLKG